MSHYIHIHKYYKHKRHYYQRCYHIWPQLLIETHERFIIIKDVIMSYPTSDGNNQSLLSQFWSNLSLPKVDKVWAWMGQRGPTPYLSSHCNWWLLRACESMSSGIEALRDYPCFGCSRRLHTQTCRMDSAHIKKKSRERTNQIVRWKWWEMGEMRTDLSKYIISVCDG